MTGLRIRNVFVKGRWYMMRTRYWALLVVAAATITVVGCGGESKSDADGASSPSTAARTDPPATDPPATDPPATDPPATDPYASTAIGYTTGGGSFRDAGWIYRFEPNFAVPPALEVAKDIQNSPPGKAVVGVAADFSGSSWQFFGDTPGRSAPALDVVNVYGVYVLPTPTENSFTMGSCTTQEGAVYRTYFIEAGLLAEDQSILLCNATERGSDGGWSNDQDEGAVDELLSAIANAGDPFFMVQFVDNCYAYYTPAQTVILAVQDQTSSPCSMELLE